MNIRNQSINLLKFIAMILVILIHCKFPGNFGILVKNFASCAVPMFFMISGYFSFETEINRISFRMKRLLRDLIWANLFYLIWDIWYEYEMQRSIVSFLQYVFSVKRALVMLLFNESPVRGHLWYLGAILYCYLFFYILLKIKRKNSVKNIEPPILLIGAIILVIGNICGFYLLQYVGMSDKTAFLLRNWIFDGLPFYMLGMYIKSREEVIRSISGTIIKLLFIVSLIINLGEIHFIQTENVIYISTAFLCIAAFSLALQNSDKQTYGWVIILGDFADRYGLLFYIIQVAVIKSVFVALRGYSLSQSLLYAWIYPVLSILLTGVIAVTVKMIINRVHRSRESRENYVKKY